MDYIKKVCVLKEITQGFSSCDKPVSGICRIEKESGVATVFLSVVNLAFAPHGEYCLCLTENGKFVYKFPLGARPLSFSKNFEDCPDFSEGFSAGVYFVKDGLPTLVAYCATEGFFCDIIRFKKCVAEKFISIKKETQNININCPYNDEAVATENYYDYDKEINDKLNYIKGCDDGLRDANGNATCHHQKEENACQDGCSGGFAETSDNDCKNYSKDAPYYDQVRGEIEDLFLRFEEDRSLKSIFPESKFVKINFSPDNYYIVGVIREQGMAKYICYGVPAKHNGTPPKELKDYCVYIPLSVFRIDGAGFWMMFQDAITGECVKSF